MIAPAWISPLATAGGLVFTGDDEGDFLVLDADTGKLLWEFAMGGFDPRNGLATYAIGGKQYVVDSMCKYLRCLRSAVDFYDLFYCC